VKLFCDEILGGLGRWLLAAGYNNSAPQEMAEQVPPAFARRRGPSAHGPVPWGPAAPMPRMRSALL